MLNSSSSETLLAEFQNPEFWKAINPGLSVNEDWTTNAVEAIAFEAELLDDVLQSLKNEGYFQIDAILPEAEMFRMAVGVATLYEMGLSTVFAFVYDEFWRITQRLSVLLSTILGKSYHQLPAVWAWYIDTQNDHAGWQPHRDRTFHTLQPDGLPQVITIWIPLSDAIPLNGCMYILPAHLDSNYHGDLKTFHLSNLQDIRALPTPAGSILGWNHNLLHWGSRSSHKAPFPRISLSCEFQRGDLEPFYTPLFSPQTLPTLSQRLGLIGRLICQYKHMYELPETLAEAAAELSRLL